jgi:hypothetical protein
MSIVVAFGIAASALSARPAVAQFADYSPPVIARSEAAIGR